MSLDNSIKVRWRPDLPDAMLRAFDVGEWRAKYNYDLEVAYWRKCWNVRNAIFDVLDIKEPNNSVTPMTSEDVEQVIVRLKQFTCNNYDYYGTIWGWIDFKKINKRNISRLKKLLRLMKKYDNIEVVFYDTW